MNEQNKFIMKCCICGREKTEQGWQYRTKAVENNIVYSHGFCALCYETEIMKIKLQASLSAMPLYQ